ncbi:hypothetical protein OAC51_01215 [Flavobacteriaceae bacterium]|nr:hypothetical protein [Flavobacteriaceae bacterium]
MIVSAISPNKDEYFGNWLDGKRHGYGKYIYFDKTEYFGKWLEGEMHGYECCTFLNGMNYEGFHFDDKKFIIDRFVELKANKIPTLLLRYNQINLNEKIPTYENTKHIPGGKKVSVV